MTEINPVAWTNEAQLGFLKDPKWAEIPMAMWAKRENYANPDIALCRHDEAMAEIDRLRNALSEILGYDRNFYDNGRPGYEKIARDALEGK